jgi:cell division GTPase FtsZ
VELSAEATVRGDEDWRDAQSHLYQELGKQVRYLWLQGQKTPEGAEKSKRTIRMVSFIEELLRKVQGTQIGQRDYLEDGVERLRRQNVDLNEASRMLAILSGSRSFTRSEVQALMAGIRRIPGEGTEILFGTSRTPADADEFHLTLIV